MNIPVAVRFRVFRVQHIRFVEMFCPFRAVFQHGTHGCIAVDIGIFTLDITVCCVFVCDILKCFHEAVIHVTDTGTFRAIQDIGFCGLHKAMINEYPFHSVLNLFNRRGINIFFFKIIRYFLCHFQASCIAFCTAGCLKGFFDGIGDFIDVKKCHSSISFRNRCNHVNPSFCLNPPIGCKFFSSAQSAMTETMGFSTLKKYNILIFVR